MSNSARYVVPKKQLRDMNARLREENEKLTLSLQDATANLVSLEEGYIKYRDAYKSITEKNLFLALISAFRLWKGERRF